MQWVGLELVFIDSSRYEIANLWGHTICKLIKLINDLQKALNFYIEYQEKLQSHEGEPLQIYSGGSQSSLDHEEALQV
jgi:hypothetical protein